MKKYRFHYKVKERQEDGSYVSKNVYKDVEDIEFSNLEVVDTLPLFGLFSADFQEAGWKRYAHLFRYKNSHDDEWVDFPFYYERELEVGELKEVIRLRVIDE